MLPSRLTRVLTDTRCAAFAIVVLAWIVYGSAMHRVFASDQLWYFAEVGGSRSLFAGLHHLDYSVTRQYWKGDDLLFRPLLFGWLAVGNWMFSYHYVWWNVANLSLHVLVTIALFRFFVTVERSPFALGAALLFLTLKPPLELVVWQHLGGYLLACLFLTIGLTAFVRLLQDPDSERSALVFALAFTVASLFYEAMVPIALAAGAILIWRGGGAGHLSLARTIRILAPLLVYATLYAIHAFRVEHLDYVDRSDGQSLFAMANAASMALGSLRMISSWAVELAMPTALDLASSPFGRFGKSIAVTLGDRLQLFNAGVVFAAIGLAAVSVSRRKLQRLLPLSALLIASIVSYTLLLGFGRSANEVVEITYYTYVFGLLTAMLVYSAIDLNRLQGWKAVAALTVLLAFIELHATGSAAEAREVERVNHYASLYITRVSQFVDAHKAEPDFSFRIEPHLDSTDPMVHLLVGYPTNSRPEWRDLTATQILFAKYYVETNPKYVLSASAERIVQPEVEGR